MKLWRKIHKWLACLVMIQLLLWISGGVVMSVFPIDNVRGEHLVTPKTESEPPLNMTISASLSITRWKNLKWHQRGEDWIIEAEDFEQNVRWLDPYSGLVAKILNEPEIKIIAESRHVNGARVDSINKLKTIPFEVRHLKKPMYQVNFNDWIHTSFYISPQTGTIASVRSDIWRLYDFFWMLHIMDYQDREDFNHPLLIGAAILSLLFVFTGFILAYFSIIKPWYAKVKYRKHH